MRPYIKKQKKPEKYIYIYEIYRALSITTLISFQKFQLTFREGSQMLIQNTLVGVILFRRIMRSD